MAAETPNPSPPMIVEVADGHIDLRRHKVVGTGQQVGLRDKEVAVLEALMEHAGQVVTREHLEREAFGYHASVSTRTVDTTVRRLRKALDTIGARDQVQTVYGEGYRWIGGPPGRRSQVGIHGRAAELEQALRWLEGEAPLLVIHGPGGMGKTLLARELAHRAQRSCWVDMTEVSAAEEAVRRVAEALGSSPDAIGPTLALRATVLVLDDCDVLDPQVGDQVAAWTAAGARVLVTRRRPYQWPAARQLRLEGLDLPGATRLWQANEGESDAAEAIWERTSGHPLSIVLAARLARNLGGEVHLLPTLERQLVDPGQPAPRHRSLEALFDSTVAGLSQRAVWLLGLLALPPEGGSPAWIGWLGRHHEGIAEGVASLRDVGLLVEWRGSLRVHGIYRALALQGVEEQVRHEHLGIWVDWVAEQARRWLVERAHSPSRATLHQAVATALRLERPVQAGMLSYAAARRAEVLALPLDPHHVELRQLIEVGGAEPWDALLGALLATTEHPPDVARGRIAVDAVQGTQWVGEANLLAARLCAHAGDGAGVQAHVTEAERWVAGWPETQVLRTWIEASEVLSYVDLHAARRRVERVGALSSHLARHDRLRWHRVAAVVHGQLFETDAHLATTTEAVELASDAHPSVLAAAWSQLGSARWNNGALDDALEATRRANALAPAARPWIRVMCANNLCAMEQECLNEAGMLAAMSTALVRAGADPRAAELASRLESGTLRYLGRVPDDVTLDAMAAQLGTTDTGWFLWQAQCGHPQAALRAATDALLPLDRAPLTAARVQRLLELGVLCLAAERMPLAAEILAACLQVLPVVSPFRVPAEAALAVALELDGAPTPSVPSRRASSPLQQLETDLWRCVLHRDATTLERLRRAHRPRPRSELGWRFEVASGLLG